uniref:Fibronectin type-III domain-containing protein n=1 Tax=Cynoglossus semilaevis TaxID=244447 RepID=A0A3P8WYY6_CYNSE
LVKCILILLILNVFHLFPSVPSSPTGPTNVVFSSVNFRNVLQWTAGNGTSRESHFTVQYAIYGDTIQGNKGKRVNWREVQHCTDIPRSWCDLSNETRDEEQGYHARVRTLDEPTLGPPLLSVEMKANEAIIHMKGPMRYQPDDYMSATSMATVYPRMTYNLTTLIHGQTVSIKTYHLPVDSNPYRYSLREHNTKYCFSATARLHFMPVQCQSSVWHCITSPQGTKNMNSTSFYPSPLTFAPENLNLNLILVSVIPDESRPDWDTTTSDFAFHKKKNASLSSEYSPQREEDPQEPDAFPIDYGFVGVASETSNGERFDRGEDRDDLNGLHKECIVGESCDKKDCGLKDAKFFNVDRTQSDSYLSQATNTITQTQTRSPINSQAHGQVEISKLVKAQPWSLGGSEVKEREDEENSGLFLNTSVFTVPSYLQQNTQVGVKEEIYKEVRVRPNESNDEAAEEGSKDETVALLSAYASQNIRVLPPNHVEQTDLLQNNYGLLSVASGMENDDDADEQEGLQIVWDSETRRLVFPGIGTEAGIDDMKEREEEKEDRVGGEEGNAVKGELKLENVFVKQASEEEIEGETEGDGEAEWEADDILSKWNLIISMDQ